MRSKETRLTKNSDMNCVGNGAHFDIACVRLLNLVTAGTCWDRGTGSGHGSQRRLAAARPDLCVCVCVWHRHQSRLSGMPWRN